MASPYSNLDSKLCRAVVAYLVSLQAGTKQDILPEEYEGGRGTYPNTTIETGVAVPDIQFTGNYRIPVFVKIRGSAAKDPNQTNPGTNRVQFDARVAKTGDSLVQQYGESADGPTQTLQATADDITAAGRALRTSTDATVAANNADMDDFTLIEWFEKGFGKGTADAEGCDWERVIMFDAVCCASKLT